VSLTAPSGDRVEVMATRPPTVQGEVNHFEGTTTENIRVVCEFPDVLPNDLTPAIVRSGLDQSRIECVMISLMHVAFMQRLSFALA
jgi:hypothetical protein